MSNVYAPGSETEGESFLWYRPTERLQIGVAYLWRQSAFRALANYEVLLETERTPNLRAGFGLQGIGTGNPGVFVTSEKNLRSGDDLFNGFVGVGWRTNENHAHLLGGVKYSRAAWTIGVQSDGHESYPFLSYQLGRASFGLYLIQFEKPAYALSLRF